MKWSQGVLLDFGTWQFAILNYKNSLQYDFLILLAVLQIILSTT